MIGIALVFAIGLYSDQEAPNGTLVERELASLVEKTNALKTFHLVYDVTYTGEEAPWNATIEVYYEAPERGRLRVITDEGGMECWIDGADLYSRGDAFGEEWLRITVPEPPPSSRLFDELFPGVQDPPDSLGPGVVLNMSVSVDPGAKPQFNCSLTWQDGSRGYVLSWLDFLKRSPSEVVIDEETLTLVDPSYRMRVSRLNGILESVEGASETGTLELKLRACNLDQPIDESILTPPSEAMSEEPDPRITQQFKQSNLDGLRRRAFLHVDSLLTSGGRHWNDVTRTDWRTLLTALHRERINQHYAPWLEELYDHVDHWAEWVWEQIEEEDSADARERLAEQVDESRAGMEEDLESARAGYVSSLPRITSEQLNPRAELFEIEGVVIDELWSVLFSKPILGAFDEKVLTLLEY